MPTTRSPRRGSMQYWPRKRAKKLRVRSWADVQAVKPLGFAGFKAGMTHVIITDNRATSHTKGESISMPVTIVECPPIKVFAVNFYKNSAYGRSLSSQILSTGADKVLQRTLSLPKKEPKKFGDLGDFDDVNLVVHTQPGFTSTGQKRPHIFEVAVGGKKEAKLEYAKSMLGKEIAVTDVFKEGDQADIHAITRGKGFQGPVKRFGVSIRQHKSEKTKRGPGTLGPWRGQGKIMYRVAHAGQMGYHLRTEFNKWIIKIGKKDEQATPKGGFINYGVVKNPYLILKGSIAGPKKRMIRLNVATRPKNIPSQAPIIKYLSLESKQGV
ncbi:MAG TPA: 50S ribosomal protein L3 [Candidatus Nanoarchaeia archaeon]|nr:50S ribosomal protein L3 [Candidatus Nanoarchaeia archaeon]